MTSTSHDHDLRIDSPWSIGERASVLLLVALVPAILVLDLVTGRGISLHVFYLVPVALAAWNLGGRAGYAIAAAAGIAWAIVAVVERGPMDVAAVTAWNALATFALFLFVAHLVGHHRGLVDGIRAHARMDGDTGALSRREFDRLLDAETRRTKRYRRPLALVVLELGEVKGERPGLVAAVARALMTNVRDCDSVSRIAARRFALLLVECKAPEHTLVVERLRDALVTNVRLHKDDLAIVVATYMGSQPTSAAGFLSHAESHLNLAKRGSGVAETRVD
jgi:GGDEF domain-containing protein